MQFLLGATRALLQSRDNRSDNCGVPLAIRVRRSLVSTSLMVPSSHIHPGGLKVKGLWSAQLSHHCKGSVGLDQELGSTLGQSPPYHRKHRR